MAPDLRGVRGWKGAGRIQYFQYLLKLEQSEPKEKVQSSGFPPRGRLWELTHFFHGVADSI